MRLIDADALIKTIERKDICTYTDTAGNTYGESDVIEYIESMPTIDHVRHGHWVCQDEWDATSGIYGRCIPILNRDEGYVNVSCHCSVCGEWLVASDEYAAIGRFCPNCGAKMDEAEETAE